MTIETRILDGKALAEKIQAQLKEYIAAKYQNNLPKLTVCIVGNDSASQVYVRKKAETAKAIGIESEIIELPKDITQADLSERISLLNQDPNTHGILLQLPLPEHLNSHEIIAQISPHKDVDGLNPENLGNLFCGEPILQPCTPYGIMSLLEEYNVPLKGSKALVIGRSRLVGRPIASLLLNQSATVTIAHSKTTDSDLKEAIKESDIIIVAIGQAEYFKGEWLEKASTIIDVGINKGPNGLVGDVDYPSCLGKAGGITPVPGGIGPLTVAHLLLNTVKAFEIQCFGSISIEL